MSERRETLGLGLLALVPIACCLGVPLVVGAGIGVAVAAWVGGAVLGAILAAVALLLLLRLRRRPGRSGLPRPVARGRP